MTDSGRLAPLVLVGCLVAAGAAAQPQPAARAVRGPQFAANVYGGWDAPLFDASAGASLQPTSQWFSGADASLTHTKDWRRVALASQASVSNRYYPQFTPSTAPSYGGSISLASISGGRWQWSLSQFAQYAPLSASSLFASAAGPNAQTLQLANATAFQQSAIRQVDISSGASLSYSITRRTSVAVDLTAGTLVPLDSPVARAVLLSGAARLSREITRDMTGYLGYRVSQNRVASQGSAAAANYEVSGVDFGIDFSRGLQLTKSTTLGFRTGLVNVPGSGGQAYQLTGGVTLDQSFRNGWNALLSATRDARFVQTYRNAVVYYGVSGSAEGRLAGPVGAIVSTNYSSGTINAATVVGFTSYSASMMLRYDLRRRVATFIEYAAFWSDVGQSLDLPGQPSGEFGRNSIRGGLSFGLSPFSAEARAGRVGRR